MKLFFTTTLFLALTILSNLKSETYSKKTDPLTESIERGSEIYTDFCMSCHLADGKGVENVYPPLAKSDYLMKNRMIC